MIAADIYPHPSMWGGAAGPGTRARQAGSTAWELKYARPQACTATTLLCSPAFRCTGRATDDLPAQRHELPHQRGEPTRRNMRPTRGGVSTARPCRTRNPLVDDGQRHEVRVVMSVPRSSAALMDDLHPSLDANPSRRIGSRGPAPTRSPLINPVLRHRVTHLHSGRVGDYVAWLALGLVRFWSFLSCASEVASYLPGSRNPFNGAPLMHVVD